MLVSVSISVSNKQTGKCQCQTNKQTNNVNVSVKQTNNIYVSVKQTNIISVSVKQTNNVSVSVSVKGMSRGNKTILQIPREKSGPYYNWVCIGRYLTRE